MDLGFLLEIERPQDRSEGYEVTFGPLFQTEIGKLQLNGNLIFKRNYQAAEANRMQSYYQFQARYRLKRELSFGVQGFGELGDYDHWRPRSEQSHRAGPAIFGKFSLGPRQSIKYNMAYLIGTTEKVNSKTLPTQVEYEF